MSHFISPNCIFSKAAMKVGIAMEIEELINKVRQGDSAAFEGIIRLFEQKIYTYCYFLLGDRQEAEDAAQDTFFKTFQIIGTYDTKGSFTAWLYKIAENHCRNLLKRKRKWMHLLPLFRPESQAKSAELIFSEQMGTEMPYWFSGLTIAEKKMLVLRIEEDYSFEEIARILEISTATARKRFERLKKKLRSKNKLKEGIIRHEQQLEL
ncbi:sigma-70 family RNA polymerase sigma factor [Paenibacillus psychroresistens]|uniref:Sigma-70 family RNA polymerase sigma factor n=2 Tax=Paenibacillus psychroresistens TaxID=1778678 RepID=A0A6B8RUF6_9BACL|nr:sigma-70 family RNA polymerase sigma factor [Paenibacillus psychroresistens]